MADAAARPDEPAGESDAESVPPSAGSAASDTGGTRSPGYGLLAGVLSVAAVALLTLSVIFGVQWRQEGAQEDRRQAALASARQTVINLTTISAQSAESDVKRLLQGTTGDFKQQFGSRRGAFVKIVKQAKVKTTGEVVAAGIEKADEDSARVLVAAKAQVTNKQAPQGQPRNYRMAIDLQRKDGQWLASGVEFVP